MELEFLTLAEVGVLAMFMLRFEAFAIVKFEFASLAKFEEVGVQV